jgi:hypothetical protein
MEKRRPERVSATELTTDSIFAFDERQDVVLSEDVAVDAEAVGFPLDIQGTDFIDGTIPAGTCVRSHYLRFNPGNVVQAVGRATFDRRILGIAFRPLNLNRSNEQLKVPGLYYEAATSPNCTGDNVDCGLESDDGVILNPRRANVEWLAGTPGDSMRVITRGCCGGICPSDD